MRAAFHEQLDSLTETLSQMCELAGAAMERATQALLQADLLSAERVITDHDHLARMQTKAEEAAFILLALQAPVAGDLRMVVATMQNLANAERMGGLAVHVAKLARRRHPDHTLPEEVNAYFAEMGKIAVDLGNSAKDVVLSRDPEQAAQIRRDDDAMDELHRHLFTVLIGPGLETRRHRRCRCHAVRSLLRTVRRSCRRDRPPGHLRGHRRTTRDVTRCRASMLFTRDNHDPQFAR